MGEIISVADLLWPNHVINGISARLTLPQEKPMNGAVAYCSKECDVRTSHHRYVRLWYFHYEDASCI